MTDRGLVITSDHLIKMELGKKCKVALQIPLVDVTSISLSPDTGNQLIIIHLRGQNNDLVMSLNSAKAEDLSGEVVGILASNYTKKIGRNLEVVASNVLRARSGKTMKPVTVYGLTSHNATFVKNKDGTITYSG